MSETTHKLPKRVRDQECPVCHDMFAAQGMGPHLTRHVNAGEITRAEARKTGYNIDRSKLRLGHTTDRADQPDVTDENEKLANPFGYVPDTQVLVVMVGSHYEGYLKNGTGKYQPVKVTVIE